MISGKGFLKQQLSTHSFPPLIPSCLQNSDIINNQSRVHWKECQGTMDCILFNNNYGTVIDWGLYGASINSCSRLMCTGHRSLSDLLSGDGYPRIVKSTYNVPISWRDRALAPPQLKMIKPI